MKIYQVDVFTLERFAGNPAGVVLDADGLGEAQMQAIARELNNSETAFVLAPDGSDHEVRVRYFTPSVEVPTCGHATVAAHFVRATVLGLPACRVMAKIGIGVLPVDIARDGLGYVITMTQGAVEVSPDLAETHQVRILAALGVGVADRDERMPMRISSTGHSKVMVGLKQEAVLHGLAPNLLELAAISGEIGCNGYYCFTYDEGRAVPVHGRMFAPAIGIAEDPVTGNANGPLGGYLVGLGFGPASGEFLFRARQGEAMGRPGEIDVRVEVEGGKPNLVQVSGRAVMVFEAEV